MFDEKERKDIWVIETDSETDLPEVSKKKDNLCEDKESEVDLFDEKEIGKRIKEIRLSLGLSLEELSYKACVSKSYLFQIERGEKSMTLDYAKRVAKGLGMTPQQLFSLNTD